MTFFFCLITYGFSVQKILKNERNPIKILQKGTAGPENRKYISNRIMGLSNEMYFGTAPLRLATETESATIDCTTVAPLALGIVQLPAMQPYSRRMAQSSKWDEKLGEDEKYE